MLTSQTRPGVTVDSRPLAGRVALVTGSSRGIGAAIVADLARCGAYGIVNYARGKDAAQGVVESIAVHGG
jgi:3-oxoacyl-[acyl-carrier protein] reductase